MNRWRVIAGGSMIAVGIATSTAAVAAAPVTPIPRGELRPLAAALAAEPLPLGAAGWPRLGLERTLGALALARPAERQRLRWNHALAALAEQRPDVALGVLGVMAQDEPDLRLTPSFRLAAGRASVEAGRMSDGLALLDDFALAGQAEACAWRLRALAGLGAARAALLQMPCAKPALIARDAGERAPFLQAAATMASLAGRPDAALHWLRFSADGPETRVARGEALLGLGRFGEAATLLAPLVASAPAGVVRARAQAASLAAEVAYGKLAPTAALARAEQLRTGWRGDSVERALLLLSWDLSLEGRRPRSGLAAAAALLRYHPSEPRLPQILSVVTVSFGQWLALDSGVPLPLAAGLLWDHRDLLPGGVGGDALVRQLAARLTREGLHARAAALLEHQLAVRARDVAQGPLSIEIAELHLLGAKPQSALDVLRRTSDTLYPADMADARLRLEAIARFQLGEEDNALSLLEDNSAVADLRAELLWRRRDWRRLAGAPVAAANADAVTQVRLLRRAIALAMIGDEAGLVAFGARHARLFVGQPSAPAFTALTSPDRGAAATDLASALAALPAAMPGGAYADLLDLPAPASVSRRPGPPAPRG